MAYSLLALNVVVRYNFFACAPFLDQYSFPSSSLCHSFLLSGPRRFDPQRGTTHLPVVALQMPPSPQERDFYEELLAARNSWAGPAAGALAREKGDTS